MELSFVGVNDAEAALLAQELRIDLLKEGVPPDALALKSGSDEHMGVGAVLFANLELIAKVLGAIGYIACFGKCLHEMTHKHQVTIKISTKEGSIEIPAANANADVIEKVLAELRKGKTDS